MLHRTTAGVFFSKLRNIILERRGKGKKASSWWASERIPRHPVGNLQALNWMNSFQSYPTLLQILQSCVHHSWSSLPWRYLHTSMHLWLCNGAPEAVICWPGRAPVPPGAREQPTCVPGPATSWGASHSHPSLLQQCCKTQCQWAPQHLLHSQWRGPKLAASNQKTHFAATASLQSTKRLRRKEGKLSLTLHFQPGQWKLHCGPEEDK